MQLSKKIVWPAGDVTPADPVNTVVLGILIPRSKDETVGCILPAAQYARDVINADPSLLPNVTVRLHEIAFTTEAQIVRGTAEMLLQTGRRYVTALLVGSFLWVHTLPAVTLAKSYGRPMISLASNSKLIPIMKEVTSWQPFIIHLSHLL